MDEFIVGVLESIDVISVHASYWGREVFDKNFHKELYSSKTSIKIVEVFY